MKCYGLRLRLLAVVSMICIFALPAIGRADTFSVLNDGIGVAPGTNMPNDVYSTSPDGAHLFDTPLDGTNTVALTPADLGLSAADEIDALSFGFDSADPASIYDVYFSVDANSQGASGTDVAWKASTSRQMGTLFDANPGQLAGVNFADTYGEDYGLNDSAYGQNNDDLDAVDLGAAPYVPGQDGDVYFSLAGDGNIYLNSLGNIFRTAASLGIEQGQDLDALAIDAVTGDVLFSLASASGYGSAADLFLNNTSNVAITAADLGLLSSDNLNALTTTAMVPEPSSLVFLATGLFGLLGLRRRAGGKGGHHV
ncbi:MAG: PEP-CTERM sorting domain-containing protein [Deltaproteobacteria bacterium]|nr:PEP-CTERM sorting domain-containing protein [Deltaproteobacteria bacterium]